MDYFEALVHTLIGMGMVFVVLTFISLIISLFVYLSRVQRAWSRFGRRLKETFQSGRKREQRMVSRIFKRPPLPESERKREKRKNKTETLKTDSALIAVIMAAIVASEGGAVSADRLVVRKIKRVRRR
ncbi:MAG: OadG family protein [Eubacterium sp.]|nr:OadG family protein [Eubacterium sp.]